MDATICALQPFVCETRRPHQRAPTERPAFIAPARRPSSSVATPGPTASHIRPRPNDIPTTIARSGKVMVVYRDMQWTCAYKDGAIVWEGDTELCSPISSGRLGFQTALSTPSAKPETIFRMEAQYCSHTYPYPNDGCADGGAPMPYAAFFREGTAFHAGDVSRLDVPLNAPYGSSHGCIRLPYATAKLLFTRYFDVQTEVIIVANPASFAKSWGPVAAK